MEVTVGKAGGVEDTLEEFLGFTRRVPNQVHRDPYLFVKAVSRAEVQLVRMSPDSFSTASC